MKTTLRFAISCIFFLKFILNIGYASKITPSINSISVKRGPLSGGTSVTLIGNGFQKGATIYFDESPCRKSIIKNKNKMVCITPPNTDGVVTIMVKNLDGEIGKLIDAYTYQSSPTINLVKFKDGNIPGETLVFITGTGFNTGATVQVNGQNCTYLTVINNSKINCSIFDNSDIYFSLTVTNTDMQVGTINIGDQNSKFIISNKKVVRNKPIKKNPTNFSLFYTASKGFFREQKLTIIGKSNQDSPITLGGSVIGIINPDYSYSGSFYLSKLDSVTSSFEEQVDIPWEYGMTFYIDYTRNNNKFFPYSGSTVDYSIKNYKYRPYAGFDYESFSTYNINEIATSSDVFNLSSIKNNLFYLTLGISHTLKIFDKTFFMKNSLSRTIYTTSSPQDTLTDESIYGYKLMIFLSTKLYDNIGGHLLYKQHFMYGPTDLDIKRIGVGFSYKL